MSRYGFWSFLISPRLVVFKSCFKCSSFAFKCNTFSNYSAQLIHHYMLLEDSSLCVTTKWIARCHPYLRLTPSGICTFLTASHSFWRAAPVTFCCWWWNGASPCTNQDIYLTSTCKRKTSDLQFTDFSKKTWYDISLPKQKVWQEFVDV